VPQHSLWHPLHRQGEKEKMDQAINIETQEWGDAKQIFAKFGLKQATLLKLARDGRIATAIIKTSPDSRKSIRVYGISSIRSLLWTCSK
jgi:hypothetical protein